MEKNNLKITGWIGTGSQTESSNLGGYLLTTEWDFTQFDDAPQKIEGQTAIQHQLDLARALQAVLDAAHHIGDVEHTNNWDPVLFVKLRNGKTVESESHYYQIDGITDKEIKVEAPSPADYKEWDQEIPTEYYVPVTNEEGPHLLIPIKDIALITIDSQ